MIHKALLITVFFSLPSYATLDHVKLTQRALMSYDSVNDKAKDLGRRLQTLTFGEYTKQLIFLTPLIDGKISYEKDNFKFKLNTRKEKASVVYVYKF